MTTTAQGRSSAFNETNGDAQTFFYPLGLALLSDAAGRSQALIVSDENRYRLQQIDLKTGKLFGTLFSPPVFSPDFVSAGTVSRFAGSGVRGTLNGAALESQFSRPNGLCVDPSNNSLLVADRSSVRRIKNGVFESSCCAL